MFQFFFFFEEWKRVHSSVKSISDDIIKKKKPLLLLQSYGNCRKVSTNIPKILAATGHSGIITDYFFANWISMRGINVCTCTYLHISSIQTFKFLVPSAKKLSIFSKISSLYVMENERDQLDRSCKESRIIAQPRMKGMSYIQKKRGMQKLDWSHLALKNTLFKARQTETQQ